MNEQIGDNIVDTVNWSKLKEVKPRTFESKTDNQTSNIMIAANRST